jgi:hypothetical protein
MPPELQLLEKKKDSGVPSSIERPVEEFEKAHETERALVCAACGHRVTRPKLGIAVNGAHEHTFINPEGVIYRIGTFSAAAGAAEVGPPSSYFSWFAGYSWRVLVCLGCSVHLGWSFRSSDSSFAGLILERLREAER